MNSKSNKHLLLCLLALSACGPMKDSQGHTQSGPPASGHDSNRQIVPVGGNAWVVNGGAITEEGLVDWTDPRIVCTVYVRVDQPGTFKLSLLMNARGGDNTIRVTVAGKSAEVAAVGNQEKEYFAGEWRINQAGYIPVVIQGVSKSGHDFGVLSGIGISGTAVSAETAYVRDNLDHYFYWGRRGPSVHLNYNTRGIENIGWFYSEITVPQGNDVIGSYFMANGFGEGYFGMQVNSETERRILFSVWSPYETDNPDAIPEDYKIRLLKKGDGVYTGEFGNEGSGGQSYLKYNWKAGNTYRFLLRGQPAGQNFTDYIAYFFAPGENQWRLIAGFRRPHTSTYLNGLYSFLENFIPETGNIPRMALYGNQWAVDKAGNWRALDKIVFTGDNTARKNFRKDYAGGVDNGQFFLKNCGFFNEFTPLDQAFSRPVGGAPPNVDFSKLP